MRNEILQVRFNKYISLNRQYFDRIQNSKSHRGGNMNG